MKFTMTVESDGDALTDEFGHMELADMLRIVADQVSDGYTEGPLRDGNGNTVGQWSYER